MELLGRWNFESLKSPTSSHWSWAVSYVPRQDISLNTVYTISLYITFHGRLSRPKRVSFTVYPYVCTALGPTLTWTAESTQVQIVGRPQIQKKVESKGRNGKRASPRKCPFACRWGSKSDLLVPRNPRNSVTWPVSQQALRQAGRYY